MKQLVVIGNGFDIAHGLPTRYSDFQIYLQSFENKPIFISENFILADSITPHDHEKLDFYEKITKYIPQEELWSAFEEALGALNEDDLEAENSDYLIGYGDDDWSDSANHDYQFMIEEDLSFASHISDYFREWITKIDTRKVPIISSDIINKRCVFLNFNYTDTLEQTYNIPDGKILYIHGKALRNDKLILGHHDIQLFQDEPVPVLKTEEEWEEFYDNQEEDFRVLEAREIIKTYYKRTYKNTAKILRKNINFFRSLSSVEKIYILGHSLSEIDIDYFKRIAKIVPASCEWNISYYDDSDFQKIKYFAKMLKLKNYCPITFEDIK